MCTGSLIGAAVGNDLAAWAPIDALRIVLVAPRRVMIKLWTKQLEATALFSLPGDPVMAIPKYVVRLP